MSEMDLNHRGRPSEEEEWLLLTSPQLQKLYSHSYSQMMLQEAKKMQNKQKQRNAFLLKQQQKVK